MLQEGLLHGDCMTVTGKTIAENIADLPPLAEGQDVIYPLPGPFLDLSWNLPVGGGAGRHLPRLEACQGDGAQRNLEDISGHLGPSRVISGHLGPSRVVSGDLG